MRNDRRDHGASGKPVRLAAMGGAYGNLAALKACLDDARAVKADVRAFLGDAIGCCGHSEEVATMVREGFDILVAGNHEQQAAARAEGCGCGYASPDDEAVSCEAFRLATAALTDKTIEWFGRWPDSAIVELAGGKVLLCHGSPGQTAEFLYEVELDNLRLDAWLRHFDVKGFVCTHSGLPFIRKLRGSRFAVNCGAVGKPDHDGDPAIHYALVELPENGEPRLEIRRVDYDYEGWAAKMERAGIQPIFVEPIRTGIWTTGVASLPASERHRYLEPSDADGRPFDDKATPTLDRTAFARTLKAFRELALLTQNEVGELLGIFDPAFPYFAAVGFASSVHAHVKVDDTALLPTAQILALGGVIENEREGYVKFAFEGGINLIFSSIDVAEEDRVEGPVPPKPFLDHFGIDLRREEGLVRAAFDDVPALARRAGWAHTPQGGLGRPVFCCHVQVGAKHWVYPLQDPSAPGVRWTKPVEFAFGPLVISGESSGCDLRPIDPRHPAAGTILACLTDHP